MSIDSNIEQVRETIRQAALRAGRDPAEVTLIAVTKTHDEQAMREAVDAGIEDIGENKAQEVRRKHPLLQRDVRWHFIGHLQRNKVKYVIDKVAMIHSVDSLSLAGEISRRAQRLDQVMPVLLEVNVSGEESKHGLAPGEVKPFLDDVRDLPGIRVQGLMTMAPYLDDPEDTRPVFRSLRKLQQELTGMGYPLDVLSMGMTNDYQVAIEEGSTHVRVGTAIFGVRKTNQ